MKRIMLVFLALSLSAPALGVEPKPQMCEATAAFGFGIWEVMLEEDDPKKRAARVAALMDTLMKTAGELYGKDSAECKELKRRVTDYYWWLESTRYAMDSYEPPWDRQPSYLYEASKRTDQDLYYFGRIRDFCDPVGK